MNTEALYRLFLETSGACTDTRNIVSNSMFFALKGANFNANAFAAEAISKGSRYAVVDEAVYATAENIILVENVLQSLQQLANYHRRQFKIPVIGLTGSNGKTTTKELLVQVLKQKYKVHATTGNFNNHIGVPLTLLAMPANAEIAVIEMGANNLTDIADLSAIAEPDFGLITNIGRAHLEGFGSYEGVITAKGQLYDHIRKVGGKIFINADDKVLTRIGDGIESYSYGIESESVIVRGKSGPGSLMLTFEWSTKDYHSGLVQTNLTGDYNLPNLLAAAAIGTYFGVEPTKISNALAQYQPDNNRSQIQKSERNTLILDAYNANPTSTEKALRSFAVINDPNKYFILGDMLELGDAAESDHQMIVQLAEKLNLNGLFVGENYEHAVAKSKLPFQCFKNTSEAEVHLKQLNLSNFLILIKGSRGIKLETLVGLL
jgi:UDP-N-acetylmuramoyl-tripeptide--D-alanyl-D-alanine ligase